MTDNNFRMPTIRQVKWIDRLYFHTQAEADERLIGIAARMGFDAEKATANCEFAAESERRDYLAVKAQAHINDNLSRGYRVCWERGNLVCRRHLNDREAAYADYQRAERKVAALVEFGADESRLRKARRAAAKTEGIWRNFVNAQRTNNLACPEGA